jgi:hypothetical protein
MGRFWGKTEAVACADCGVLIEVIHAQLVPVKRNYSMGETELRYYCTRHTRAYDRAEIGGEVRYFKDLPVEFDGSPIGYVPAPVKRKKAGQ